MKTHNLTDYDLVKQFQEGKQSGIETLIHRHKSRVYSYILLTVRDTELAEDFFQDTFIKVIKSLREGNYCHQGKFVSWVLRIAHNLIIDYYRQNSKQQTYSTDCHDNDIFKGLKIQDKNVEEELIDDQISEDIKYLINELSEEQKQVILLRHYCDMSFKEISEYTGVSINTALGRMRYALVNLRRLIVKKNISLTKI